MGWNNVSLDSLPKPKWGEVDRLVIITYHGAMGDMTLPARFYFDTQKFRFLAEQGLEIIPKGKVLAWQDFPEPYRETGDNQKKEVENIDNIMRHETASRKARSKKQVVC